jgi:hypothetical protein
VAENERGWWKHCWLSGGGNLANGEGKREREREFWNKFIVTMSRLFVCDQRFLDLLVLKFNLY